MPNIPNWVLTLVLGMMPASLQPLIKDIEADIAAKGIVNPIPQLNDFLDAIPVIFPKYAKICADAKKLLNDSIATIIPDVEAIIADAKAIQ